MTTAVESLLRDLQGVAAARHLYPSEHPRLAEAVARVVSHAVELTEARPEVSVFLADNRLVWNGSPLPNGDTLARGVFATMRANGFQRLTIRRGLTSSEVVEFASAIVAAQRQADGIGALHSSAHLRLSAIDTSGARGSANRLEFSVEALGDQSLAQVWEGLIERRQLDFDAVDLMVMALCRTLDDNAAAMLPLAQLKSHDDYTVTHITNVALLTTALGEACGLPAASLRELAIAALLHDIGKLRVPADVLNETGRLNDDQRAMIQRHPEDGARMLLATPGVPDLAVIVAFEHHLHHEGGGGYPQVPRSWKVNLASEMTHIADVFDALRSNRPYRAGMARDRIADIMRSDAGTAFDPGLIDIFLTVVAPRTGEQAAAGQAMVGAATGP